MIYLTQSVKLFNGHIFHKRIGNIDHFFKNRINALLIDLKKEDENIQEKFPLFFSTLTTVAIHSIIPVNIIIFVFASVKLAIN